MLEELNVILDEMMKNAAEEIGIKFNRYHSQEIINKLEINYGIELNDDGPITWKLMVMITDEIQDWIKRNK